MKYIYIIIYANKNFHDNHVKVSCSGTLRWYRLLFYICSFLLCVTHTLIVWCATSLVRSFFREQMKVNAQKGHTLRQLTRSTVIKFSEIFLYSLNQS